MRLDKWFISNLDDSQRQIIVRNPNESLIIQGTAGSGKTNLAIHRALQASVFGSYAIVIYTIALKRMISYGMDALGLDKERIAYDWQFSNRGFDLDGFVYCKMDTSRIHGIDTDCLFLVQDTIVKKYRSSEYSEEKKNMLVSIDFADWVDSRFYYTFKRRTRWFEEVTLDEHFNINNEKYILIPSGTLFKKAEDRIDYLIIDEVQDFNITQIKDQFVSRAHKSLTLFGDTAQKIYKDRGASIDAIYSALKFKRFFLKYNYRLPKSIAKMAQDILVPSIDLLTDNKKDDGNSDFPYYPKPVLTKYKNQDDELAGILNKIILEDLDDVAILVPTEEDVKLVNNYLTSNNIQTQVHYRTGKTVPFRTINTLDFSNNDLPCILTYHAAKGTEFDNVFVPFAKMTKITDRNAFYVACTRSSRSLHISFTGIRTNYLEKINLNFVDYHEE